MANYTKQSYDFSGEGQMLRFLAGDLGLTCLGMGLGRIPPGAGWPFFHSHEKQEEVYVCLDGSLTMIVDGEEVRLETGDIVRVPAEVNRAVGNRTSRPGTILILGAMPFEGHSDPDRPALINDGVRAPELGEPDWSVTE